MSSAQSNNPLQSTALYIGNLDETITQERIFHLFQNYNVWNIRYPYDKIKKKNKHFAFVTFKTPKEARDAYLATKYTKLGNRVLRINPVIPNFKEMMSNNIANNVFVKDLSDTITGREFDAFFGKFGQVVTSLLKTDLNGRSLRYGYVMYRNKEEASNCIDNANGMVMDNDGSGRVISVNKFLPTGSSDRPNVSAASKCNLYIRDFTTEPFDSEDAEEIKAYKKEWEGKIKAVFEKFGEITSMVVQIDPKLKLPYSYVCYGDNKMAVAAIEATKDQDVFENGKTIYVDFHQTKASRKAAMNRAGGQTNKCKIYVRDLKLDVTNETFAAVFSKFGEIKTSSVKQNTVQEQAKKFGMIDFSTPIEAQKAINEGPQDSDVKALLQDPTQFAYIRLAQTAAERRKFIQFKKQQQSQRSNFLFGNMSKRNLPTLQMMPNPMMIGQM